MRELISNVFTIDCFSKIYKLATDTDDKNSGKWKNIIGSYPLFVKTFHIEGNLLTIPKKCVTIGGLYFFWFLENIKYDKTKDILKGFLQEEQQIPTIENFFLYESSEASCVFRDIIIAKGQEFGLLTTEPFNRALVRLIEDYTIIPVKAQNGIIWSLNEKNSDLSELESTLMKYSGWLDYNELKRSH